MQIRSPSHSIIWRCRHPSDITTLPSIYIHYFFPYISIIPDDVSALSTGELMKASLFKVVIKDCHDKLVLVSHDNNKISLPVSTVQQDASTILSCESTSLYQCTKRTIKSFHQQILQPQYHYLNVKLESPLYSMILHQKYCHRPISVIQNMVD